MVRPTDGDEPAANLEHPDLSGVAGEMRAEWRAEQESAAADAVAQRRHNHTLVDWLCDRMHAGDRIAVSIAARSFVGIVEEVGDDLVALRSPAGRVEIQVGAAAPVSFELVEHATEGGTRGVVGGTFRDALMGRDEQLRLKVGTVEYAEGIDGTLFVSRDYVTVVAETGVESIVPIAHIVWVAPDRA
jgi:hypothetical protein